MNDNDTEAQNAPSPPPEEAATKQTFVEAALARFRATIAETFTAIPEVRSVVVVLDYRGGLNDAPDIKKALWKTDTGRVDIASGHGMIHNMMEVLEMQFRQMADAHQQMMDRAAALGGELLRRQEELAKLNKDTAAQPQRSFFEKYDVLYHNGNEVYFKGGPNQDETRLVETDVTAAQLEAAGYVKDPIAFGPLYRWRRRFNVTKTEERPVGRRQPFQDHEVVYLNGDEVIYKHGHQDHRVVQIGVTPEQLEAAGYGKVAGHGNCWRRISAAPEAAKAEDRPAERRNAFSSIHHDVVFLHNNCLYTIPPNSEQGWEHSWVAQHIVPSDLEAAGYVQEVPPQQLGVGYGYTRWRKTGSTTSEPGSAAG